MNSLKLSRAQSSKSNRMQLESNDSQVKLEIEKE